MKNSKNDKIDTLIGNSAEIEGNIVFSGGLRIDGKVNGSVYGKQDSSTLIISENASVNGEINVTSAYIDGSVVGSVFASDYLELKSKANIMGDVNYASMEIHLGAIISGNLIHNENNLEEKGEKVEY
jgi:cytoskeletal protein CcmA (bactofilin family)